MFPYKSMRFGELMKRMERIETIFTLADEKSGIHDRL
jgi:hypothetical protein